MIEILLKALGFRKRKDYTVCKGEMLRINHSNGCAEPNWNNPKVRKNMNNQLEKLWRINND